MISLEEFHLIRDYIEKHCGIYLSDEKVYLVETRLTTLMFEQGCGSFGELYKKAVLDRTHVLRDKIIENITTNETYWFRDLHPFGILNEVLFKHYADEITAGRRDKIRIWCSACSTGQEPYSIAMTFREFMRENPRLRPDHIEITASDISSTVLFIGKMGRYDSLSISRGLSEEFRDRYFVRDDKVWTIKDEIKQMVKFQKLNLQENFHHLGRQDIVFCRNILIYFSMEFKQNILRRIASLLRPNGYLFLGASESIIMYTQEYEMLRHAMGLYYQIKQNEEKHHAYSVR
ncbi:MAG: protein-glutamate O-methyltransferase CheR [Desulfobulbaceae bacterium]|jgi:chemotaxis protein methyltransferase CheR|nr:protein-glutamate O-methyltransferase CheR [Desulfobulbaceae bacterium]MDY0350583.1 protein-glutamate O-methyltransferase CheR [Desulfobulbaceae bacterium]